MPENYTGQDQWGDYERLLEQHYPDVPDEWDMYEDMGAIREAFAQGRTAREVFDAHHGMWFGRHVQAAPTYTYDGSEFGD